MKYYRLEKAKDTSIELEKGKDGDVEGPLSVGTGEYTGKDIALSELIDILNARMGTNFKPVDQLFFDQIREDAMANEELREAALVNTMENFGYVFFKALENLFIDRMDMNEDITARLINERDFREIVSGHLLREVYDRITCGFG